MKNDEARERLSKSIDLLHAAQGVLSDAGFQLRRAAWFESVLDSYMNYHANPSRVLKDISIQIEEMIDTVAVWESHFKE